MSTKGAAREEAWKKSAAYRAVTEDGESYKARDYYREGFDAGYESARDQWTAINSVEDLPKETGWYLTTLEAPFDQKSQYQFFDGKGFDLRAKVLAWRPLPEPYQQGGE